ncbi:type II secretion system F family protein [Candidatus Gottesmanbacteria bacterium]|nr:type II secretion system F family protein [Candidatus Gottesmanbacteria bacterium]
MAQFFYKALTNDKKITQGSIAGKSKEEVASILSRRSLVPLTIKPFSQWTVVRGTIPQIDKITFCRYIAVMLSSGLPLSDGIEVMRSETKHPFMKKILADISYSLEQGQQLSTIFERYPDTFESYFLTLTRAGEVSGKLAEVFHYIELELRAEYSLQSKVKGALLYPMIVFIAMLGIGFMMFFFVLPQIGKVFLNLKLPLPTITKMIFQLSIVLSRFMIPILVIFVILSIGVFFLLKKKSIRTFLFHLITPIPIVKNLLIKVDMARFTRIFSTLIKSAVPITEALEISLLSLSWPDFRRGAKTIPNDIRKGKTLSLALKEQNVFPTLMIQMVQAGEKTASLDTTLSDLATYYEGEVEEELKSLTQILEPVLMLLVGIGVGAMILSIIAPIYSVVGSFQNAASPGAPR